MKKNCFVLLITLSIFAFIGCSDVSENKNAALEDNSVGCVVRGNVFVGDSSNESITSRSATTSLEWRTDELLSVGEASIKAFKDDDLEVTGEIAEDGTYSIVLNRDGYWRLCVFYTGTFKKTVNGVDETSEETALYGEVSVEIDESFSPIMQNIWVAPRYISNFNGEINLSIKNNITDDFVVSSIQYEGIHCGGIVADVAPFSGSTEFDENGIATVHETDVLPGSYEVSFYFKDETGNTLYCTKQAVSVFSGYVTDKWFGEDKDLNNSEGVCVLEITKEKILSYKSEYETLNTDTILFTPNTDDGGYDLYRGDTKIHNTASNKYVIGKDNKVYVFDYFPDAEDPDKKAVINVIPNDNNPSPNYVASTDINNGYGIAIDYQTDALYTYFGTYLEGGEQIPNGKGLVLRKYEDCSLGSAPVVYTLDFSLFFDDGYSERKHEKIQIFNDVLYDLISKSNSYSTTYDLVRVKLNSDSDVITCSESDIIQNDILNEQTNNYWTFTGKGGNTEITDMIVQDEKVYLLLKQSYFRFGNSVPKCGYESRGAVMRIDPLFGMSVIGWTCIPDERYTTQISVPNIFTLSATQFDFGGCIDNQSYGLYTSGDISDDDPNNWTHPYAIFNKYDKPLTVISKDYSYEGTLYVAVPTYKSLDPSNDTGTVALCGPMKFIGIKPKKLVIADNGIAFYTDKDGLWCYTNVNRVVTVDLDKFAIESSDKASLKFAEDKEDSLIIRGSDWDKEYELWAGESEFLTTYYTDGEFRTEFISDGTCCYLGFSCNNIED